MLELPCVSVPAAAGEGIHHLGGESTVQPVFCIVLFQEKEGERQYVLLPLPQRRYVKLDDVQPIVQISAELSLFDLRRQILV